MLKCCFQVSGITLNVLKGKQAINVIRVEVRMGLQYIVFVRLFFFVKQILPLILDESLNLILSFCLVFLLFRILFFCCLLLVFASFLLYFLVFSFDFLLLLGSQLFFVRKGSYNALAIYSIELSFHSLLLPKFFRNRLSFFKQLNALLSFNDIAKVNN